MMHMLLIVAKKCVSVVRHSAYFGPSVWVGNRLLFGEFIWFQGNHEAMIWF